MPRKYSGLYTAAGAPFTDDGVALTPTENKFDASYLRQQSYLMNFTRLVDIGLSVFKWENLPDGIDERQVEWWLLSRGYAVFLYDDMTVGTYDMPEGYAVLPCTLNGEFDIYGYPNDRTAYAINGYTKQLTEDNSVIMFNSQLRSPMLPVLSLYAWRLTNCDSAIDMNVRNQKVSKIALIDTKTSLTVKNIANQYDDGVEWIYAAKNFNPQVFQQLDLTSPFVARDVMDVRNQIFNQALTYLGVENVNTDKKERLVSGEVYGGMGAVEAQRFTRLVARESAADKINETFGLNIKVEFRSGMYIRTDKEGTVPTTGFGEANPQLFDTFNKQSEVG